MTIKSGNDVFTVVDFVPLGYKIWNIGKNMIDGYLPLCRPNPCQPFDGACCIERDTLKAIKTDGAQTILAAIGGGQDTIKKMENYIRRYADAKPGTYAHRQVERIKKALPYMYELKWA